MDAYDLTQTHVPSTGTNTPKPETASDETIRNDKQAASSGEEEEREEKIGEENAEQASSPSQSVQAQDNTMHLEDEINKMVDQFSASEWGVKLGSFFQTVKKQSELALDATRKDLQEAKKDINVLQNVAQKELGYLTEQIRQHSFAPETLGGLIGSSEQPSGSDERAAAGGEEPQTNNIQESNEQQADSMFNVIKNLAKKNVQALGEAEDKADAYLETYLTKIGKDVGDIFRKGISLAEPEGSSSRQQRGGETSTASSSVIFDAPDSRGSDANLKNQIYISRLEAQLHVLHSSTEPFTVETNEPKFKEFAENFKLDQNSNKELLEKYPELKALQEKLVPNKISQDEFWKKYYFLRSQIDEEEAKRKMLLEQAKANVEGDDFDWDEEDEDDTQDNQKQAGSSSSRSTKAATATATTTKDIVPGSLPSSESSYDVVSADVAKDEQAKKPSKQIADEEDDDEDEDDDWE